MMIALWMFVLAQQQLEVASSQGGYDFNCAELHYDTLLIEVQLYLRDATNPDKMQAVRFDPEHFGYSYPVFLQEICHADFLDCPICAPRTRVFVYGQGDDGPDVDDIITSYYIDETGDQGEIHIEFSPPLEINEPFWVVNRGDPTTPGGHLGIEGFDTPGLALESYSSILGPDLLGRDNWDLGVQVTLSQQPGPFPVPALSRVGQFVLILVLLGVGIAVKRRLGGSR